jgi:hypothetical protein
MPVNLLTEACICRVREAMVFWSPSSARLHQGTSQAKAHPRLHGRVQIVDVFSLEVATGYSRDPHGRLLLHAAPSVAQGRSWSLAKAAQLIRNDARPHRWVALQLDNRAWGLFWAGGGLQRCRELLAEQVQDAEACSALVPVTADRVLELVLSGQQHSSTNPGHKTRAGTQRRAMPSWPVPAMAGSDPWRLVLITSAIWLALLAAVVSGFVVLLERQNRTLQLLLERTEPSFERSTNQP